MVTIVNQVKAFKEVKRRNDNHEPLNLMEISNRYGFDVSYMLQKKIMRRMAKIGMRSK